MNDSIVVLQPAFIIQHRKYGETSLIIDVLTKDYGIISLLAKGVRKKKSKTAGILLPFLSLKISFIGKNELKILTHAELESSDIQLKGLSLYCGFYINELVINFLYKNDAHVEVFDEYRRNLSLLSLDYQTEQILRYFELNLLEYVGYGIQLTVDTKDSMQVEQQTKYSFEEELGIVENPKGYITGQTLLALQARENLKIQELYEAKQLLRHVIDYQMQGKELKSRAVLAKLIKII